jgi:hypothetical protein
MIVFRREGDGKEGWDRIRNVHLMKVRLTMSLSDTQSNGHVQLSVNTKPTKQNSDRPVSIPVDVG